jgi:hypothetical protein
VYVRDYETTAADSRQAHGACPSLYSAGMLIRASVANCIAFGVRQEVGDEAFRLAWIRLIPVSDQHSREFAGKLPATS